MSYPKRRSGAQDEISIVSLPNGWLRAHKPGSYQDFRTVEEASRVLSMVPGEIQRVIDTSLRLLSVCPLVSDGGYRTPTGEFDVTVIQSQSA